MASGSSLEKLPPDPSPATQENVEQEVCQAIKLVEGPPSEQRNNNLNRVAPRTTAR
jgi:hypothetical protein